MERRRTATARGLYDSFCHIFFFLHSFSLHLFVSQKSLNDEERGGNCLLVPERYVATGLPPAGSRGRAPGRGSVGRSPQKLKAFCFTIFSEACAEIKGFNRFLAWWIKMRGITQGCALLGLKYLMWCWLLADKRLLKLLKLNNSFIVSFVTMDNSRPKYKKKLDMFLGGMWFFFGGGDIPPMDA